MIEETQAPEPPQDGEDTGDDDSTQDGVDTGDSGSDGGQSADAESELPADPSENLDESAGQASPEVDLQGLEGGCQSVPASSWWGLSLLGFLALRRRRRRWRPFQV